MVIPALKGLQPLNKVATLADHDEWRARVRGHVVLSNKRDRRAVDELVGKAEGAALPPAAARLLARACILRGAPDQASDILCAAQQRHPTDFWLNHDLAFRLVTSNRVTQRERRLGFARLAQALRPHSPGLHFTLGEKLAEAGLLDQAIAATRKSLELKPDYPAAHYRLGTVHFRKRDWQNALVEYSKAIQFGRPGLRPYMLRGRVYAELGRWNEAAADYGQLDSRVLAGGFDPKLAVATALTPDCWCEAAAVHLLAGKPEAYRELCGRALAVYERLSQPQKVEAAVPISWMCVLGPDATDDPARAVRLAEQAVADYPRAVSPLYVLGMAHYRAGDFRRAIEHFGKADAVKDAKSAQALPWLGLAMAYHRSGQGEQARPWLNQALKWLDGAGMNPPKEATASPPELPLRERLACLILRREVESLLNSEELPPPRGE
jgi:Flp pilus assembly protein TadD